MRRLKGGSKQGHRLEKGPSHLAWCPPGPRTDQSHRVTEPRETLLRLLVRVGILALGKSDKQGSSALGTPVCPGSGPGGHSRPTQGTELQAGLTPDRRPRPGVRAPAKMHVRDRPVGTLPISGPGPAAPLTTAQFPTTMVRRVTWRPDSSEPHPPPFTLGLAARLAHRPAGEAHHGWERPAGLGAIATVKYCPQGPETFLKEPVASHTPTCLSEACPDWAPAGVPKLGPPAASVSRGTGPDHRSLSPLAAFALCDSRAGRQAEHSYCLALGGRG